MGDDSFCSGESVSLIVTGLFETFEWSDDSEGQTNVISTGGEYSVTATDINGCQDTASIIINELTSPDLMVIGDDFYCNGGSTTLDAGPGYETYQWSTNSTEQSIEVSSPTTYGLTVTNANGCSADTLISVEEFSIVAPALSGPQGLCPEEEGEITVLFPYSEYPISRLL